MMNTTTNYNSTTNIIMSEDPYHDDLSHAQYATLVVVARAMACLSLVGSFLILYMAYPKVRTNVYHRLMSLLSAVDILFSISVILQPFLLPVSPETPWAVGTPATCSAVGAIGTLATAMTPWYNACLSVYFWILVRCTTKWNSTMVWYWELPAHVIIVLLSVGLATTALVTQSYAKGAILDACVLSTTPAGCLYDDSVECQHGETWAPLLQLLKLSLVVVASCVGLLATMGVYCQVRRQLQTTKNGVSSRGSWSLTGGGATSTTSTTATTTTSPTPPQDPDKTRRITQVRNQALWYTLIYINYILWPTILNILSKLHFESMHHRGSPALFTVVLLASLLYPLQGALNFIVYIRPRYQTWREYFPEFTSLHIVYGIVTHKTFADYHAASNDTRRSHHGQKNVSTGSRSNRSVLPR